MTPKILLVCTARWFPPARLAVAFVNAECSVEVVCPRGHPVVKTRATCRIHPYHALAPLRSIGAAIEEAQPDFIIPCDDLATIHLHRLYDRALQSGEPAAATRALLEKSLGEPSSFSIAEARTRLMTFAHEQGIRVPLTAVVDTTDELTDWIARNGLPAVLKADGTWGGRGVRFSYTLPDACRAWQAFSFPAYAAEALKHAIFNRDMNYVLPCLLRARPMVGVQRFVSGQDANRTVACWKGRVLAGITVAVLHTLYAHGPASVVRIIENRQISAAVEKIVCQLKLSGLLGFDFIIEEGTGDPYLIEMNPRATQICHLQLGIGRNLPGSLRAILSGEPLGETPSVTENEVIAFFPQEWLTDPASQFLRTAYHDVPWEEPDLIRACVKENPRLKTWKAISSMMRSPRAPLPCRQTLPDRQRSGVLQMESLTETDPH